MQPTPHPVQALLRLLQRVFSSDPPVLKEVPVEQISRKVPAFSLENKDLYERTVLNAEQSRPSAVTSDESQVMRLSRSFLSLVTRHLALPTRSSRTAALPPVSAGRPGARDKSWR